jgi:hypothetical protein
MSFHVHIADIVNDACKRLGFVMRNSKHLNDIYAPNLLFNGRVRSILVYASIIRCPVHKSYQNQIEQIQKRFSRYLYYKKYHIPACQNKISYTKLLKEFNYVTLASRHDISEQAFIYKTVNGVLDNSAYLEQFNFHIRKGNLCTRHLFCYHIPKNSNFQELTIA